MRTGTTNAVLVLLSSLLLGFPTVRAGSGQDLKLTYRSSLDDTDQPYRLYVPSGYDPARPFPLVIALHGTTGDENTFFENPSYLGHPVVAAAEKYGTLIVCPFGRGAMEYRGVAENDVFEVLSEVRRKYRIDPERIYITGHSMGGTGAAYLALHHPDVFAASAPLACGADYSWHRVGGNGKIVPLWFISGEKDQARFVETVKRGVAENLADSARLTILPGEGHYGPVGDMEAVVAWLVQHRLERFPKEFEFFVDTPLHGKAFWIRVDEMAEPGQMGAVRAQIQGSTLHFFPEKIRRFAVLTYIAELFEPGRQFAVYIADQQVFAGRFPETQELEVTAEKGAWKAKLVARRDRRPTDIRFTPIAQIASQADMRGVEATLGNWVTDAMRWATNADIALLGRDNYRGLPIRPGTVDVIDLINAFNVDRYLTVVTLSGAQLLKVLDENVPDPNHQHAYIMDGPEASGATQISGASYTFDPGPPGGEKIVSSSLIPGRIYTVAVEESWLPGDRNYLGIPVEQLSARKLDTTLFMAFYGYTARSARLAPGREGRVKEVHRGTDQLDRH